MGGSHPDMDGKGERIWTNIQRLGPMVEQALEVLASQTWGDDYSMGRPSEEAVAAGPDSCCWLAFHRDGRRPWQGWAYGVWLRFDAEGGPEAFEVCISPLAVSRMWAGAPTEAGLRGLLGEYHQNGPTSIGPF